MTNLRSTDPLPPLFERNLSGLGCVLFYLGILGAVPIAAIANSRWGSWNESVVVEVALLGLLSMWGATLVALSIREAPKKRQFVIRLPGFLTVAALLALLLALAIPSVLDGLRPRGHESGVIGALKTISAAQSLYRESDKEGDGNLDYGTLKELGEAGTTGLIDSILASGTKHGYLFETSYGATTSEFIWIATARPILPLVTGDRYFVTNHEGVTFYTTEQPFLFNSADCTIAAGVNPVGR